MYSGDSQTLHRNISPPSSGSKSNPNEKNHHKQISNCWDNTVPCLLKVRIVKPVETAVAREQQSIKKKIIYERLLQLINVNNILVEEQY
jgi:hypothetical protein